MKVFVAKQAGLALAAITFSVAAPALASSGSVLVQPGGTQQWVCSFSTSTNPAGAPTMVQSIPRSASFALGGSGGGTLHPLSSYPVYIIFVGHHWTTDGTTSGLLTSVAKSMISDAQTILSSTYLSGLTQYGSVGSAYYAGYYVDACSGDNTNLGFVEADRAITPHGDGCQNPNYTTWAKATGTKGGDASNSAIFVSVIDSRSSGTAGGNDFSGLDSVGTTHNSSFGNPPVNVAAIGVPTPITTADADGFSWALSHEVAERMSSGTAARTDQCASPGTTGVGQICDGEPEDQGLTVSIQSTDGTVTAPATAYWSVVDQAFIAPGASIPNSDGSSDARILVKNINNCTNGNCSIGKVSLRQGTLSSFGMSDAVVPTGQTIDTSIRAYTVDASGTVYDISTAGQVRKLTGSLSSPSWTAITGSSTSALQVIAPTVSPPCATGYGVVGSGLFQVASNNGGPPQVWQYSGSGTNWTALTGTNTTVNAIVATVSAQCPGGTPSGTTNLYLWAGGSQAGVWHWSSGQNWTLITGSSTTVLDVAVANDQLYMLAHNGQGNNQIWQYSGSGTNWSAITPSSANADELMTAGDVLTTDLQVSTSQPFQLWQYIPGGSLTSNLSPNWTPITGTNTTLEQTVKATLQDNVEIYMAASNGGNTQVWEFQGIGPQVNSTWGFTPLTSTSSFQVNDLFPFGPLLQMYAVPTGGSTHLYQYTGTPFIWTLLQ